MVVKTLFALLCFACIFQQSNEKKLGFVLKFEILMIRLIGFNRFIWSNCRAIKGFQVHIIKLSDVVDFFGVFCAFFDVRSVFYAENQR